MSMEKTQIHVLKKRESKQWNNKEIMRHIRHYISDYSRKETLRVIWIPGRDGKETGRKFSQKKWECLKP